MRDLKMQADHSMIDQIARAANTPEQQISFLAALRNQAQNTSDKSESEQLLNNGMRDLFSQVSRSGYDRSLAWIKSADLTPKETEQFASSLNYYQTKNDTGKWLDWMASQPLDTGKIDSTTSHLVSQWTVKDYKAAGEWLTTTSPGPVKEAATMAYLQTVAPYDPDTAAQWADTLPAGKRKQALSQIYNALKDKDPGSAENFASSHGIQTK